MTELHNLPHLTTSFIGRQAEIDEIGRLLDTPVCQLLTLVGPGGMGKTRLAIEIARERQEKFAHGVWFVSLAPLTAHEQIPAAIVKALEIQIGGQSALDEILKFLKHKQLLLVLDNFEHLLEGTSVIEAILTAAPGVKIVVTSRITLNMQAEWAQSVSGMRYPASDTDENWDKFSAVRLFAERAKRVRPDFLLNQSGACAVQICQLVDGMPLAIELAAAWLKTIPCNSIPDQIQRGLDFLASNQRDIPERQRSIRAVFDQSWKMLTPEEQQVFPRFSVFRGGCALEAVEQVTGASLSMVASLVEKSLLTLEPTGRYGIHELLRQYGEEKLTASGEMEAVCQAHSTYYSQFMKLRETDLKEFRQVEALDEIEPDFENVRDAWLWALGQRDFDAIDLALESLHRFSQARTRFKDITELFGQAYTRLAPVGDEPPHRVWGRVLSRLMEADDTYTEETAKYRQKSLEIARFYGDPMEIGIALHWLGESLNNLGRFQEAISSLEESLTILRGLGERTYASRTLNELARCHRFKGEPGKGIPYSLEALNLRREINDRIGVGWCLFDLADAYFDVGQVDEAERCCLEALKYFEEVRSFYALSSTYSTFIAEKFLTGKLEQSLQRADEYLEICRTYNSDPPAYIRDVIGVVSGTAGDYARCRTLCESVLKLPGRFFPARWGLAAADWGDYKPDEVLKHFREMLQSPGFTQANRHYLQIPCLPFAAILLDHDGEQEWAAEVMGLAYKCPSHLNGWMKRWTAITDLLDRLETVLGTDVFLAAWERGESLDLDEAIARIRVQFLSNPDAQKQANEVLNEPLTARELEVLNLIHAGLSNPEIAERFVLAESTVKRHINHIYGKLGVETRPEALARARELGLLK